MKGRARLFGLPLVAVLLVAAVLAVQLSAGGRSFAPTPTADPCSSRPVTSTVDGIEGLTERLVLVGIDGAGCRLGTSREAFVLRLAAPEGLSDREVEALRGGLLDGVGRLRDEGSLPAASTLLEEALDGIELNGFLRTALLALPDAALDAALSTEDVLVRVLEDLDLRATLGQVDDRGDLERALARAVVPAVRDSLIARVRSLF